MRETVISVLQWEELLVMATTALPRLERVVGQRCGGLSSATSAAENELVQKWHPYLKLLDDREFYCDEDPAPSQDRLLADLERMC